MKPFPASVRCLLVVLLATCTISYGAAELVAPGVVCKTFQLCHNSQGVAYTSVSLFSAMEPLFRDLGLATAVNEYIDVKPGSRSEVGCSCATPVQVHLSIPTNGQRHHLVDELVSSFIDQSLPLAMSSVACVGDVKTVQCKAADVATARRKLSEMEIELAPGPVATTFASVSEAAATAEGDSGAYGGYGDYGYGQYGGGYGDYGQYTYSGGEAPRPVARNLLASPVGEAAAAAAGKVQQIAEKASQAVAGATCPRCPSCAEAAAAAAATAIEKLAAAPSPAPAAAGAATCYCRYNEASSSWALHEPACKGALYRKCSRSSNSLLECSQLDAHYAAYSTPSLEAPFTMEISDFLFVDCPPAAPCSCGQLRLDGRDPSAAVGQCCADLKAHCQVPFSGLACEDVDRFCAVGMAKDDAVAAFVKVKTHSMDCSAPTAATRAYKTVTNGAITSSEAAAALLEGAPAPAGPGLNMVLIMVASGCIALAAAVAGIVALWQHYSERQYAAPLLGEY